MLLVEGAEESRYPSACSKGSPGRHSRCRLASDFQRFAPKGDFLSHLGIEYAGHIAHLQR